MLNTKQSLEQPTLKDLVKVLPSRYGYALKVRDSLTKKGVDVTKEMIYQTVFGNTRHPDITREVIALVRDYKKSRKELDQEINDVLAD